jgi:hypothetical protein
MKTGTILLLIGGGVLAYFLYKKSQTAPAGTSPSTSSLLNTLFTDPSQILNNLNSTGLESSGGQSTTQGSNNPTNVNSGNPGNPDTNQVGNGASYSNGWASD